MTLPTLAEARAELGSLASALPTRSGRVRLDASGPVARLLIDHAEARNALTPTMMVDLADALAELQRWDGAALVVSAASEDTPGETPGATKAPDPGPPKGRTFCAGGHLGDVRAGLGEPEAGLRMARAMTIVLDGFLDLPLVSVVALDGLAVGGGAELLTAFDHRVATRRSRVHWVQARLGVASGWGGAARLVGLVGRRVAVRLLTEASPVDADHAVALGLVDAVTDGDAVAAALDFLAPVLALPPRAVRAAKAQAAAASPARADDAEARLFATVWGGPDHREALQRLPGARR